MQEDVELKKHLQKHFMRVDPEQYDIMAKSKGYLLAFYNGIVVSVGALGIFLGLERILR